LPPLSSADQEDALRAVLGHLPRPERLGFKESHPVPMMRRLSFRAPFWRVVKRIRMWLGPVLKFAPGLVSERFRRGRDLTQFGVELRDDLEAMGGTFVKIGQQLATRHDLLPSEVCFELGKMLDRTKAFDAVHAFAAIERCCGRPLEEIFETFDPMPIGTGSVACVYRAVLKGGDHVAVKVRRPKIGEDFAVDLAALDFIARVLEAVTVIRPGSTLGARRGIRDMLMEELDFRVEARYQSIFRARVAKDGPAGVRVPRVYGHLCNEEVIVSEFISGVWLFDLIAAREAGDETILANLEEAGIDPRVVARKLLFVRNWSLQENLFYHADPHPGNIVVQPGNTVVLIDFGACGPSSWRARRNLAEVYRRIAREDGQGLVQVFHNMLSPLPQLDLPDFIQIAEPDIFNWLYGLAVDESEWYDQTTAGLWIDLFRHARNVGLYINADTIRLMRSTLMYDTVAARLDPKIDLREEFERYDRETRYRRANELLERLRRRFGDHGLLLEFGEALDVADRLMYRVRHLSEQPVTTFLATVGKAAFVTRQMLRAGLGIGVALGVIAGYGQLKELWTGDSVDILQLFGSVLSSPLVWVVIGVMAFHTYRSTQIRMGDIDSQNG